MMNTRAFLSGVAILLFAAGLACLLAPVATAEHLGLAAPGAIHPAVVQLAGAPLLGLAMLDYVGRGARAGGIYSRPLVVANFVHFAVGLAIFARAAADATVSVSAGFKPLWICAMIYAAGALGFGKLLFFAPRDGAPSEAM